MKAKIEFDLPEEQAEYETHCNAAKMSLILYEFSNAIRDKTKYGNSTEWDEVHKVWWDLLYDFKINPYES